jgi:hypothetical protein
MQPIVGDSIAHVAGVTWVAVDPPYRLQECVTTHPFASDFDVLTCPDYRARKSAPRRRYSLPGKELITFTRHFEHAAKRRERAARCRELSRDAKR